MKMVPKSRKPSFQAQNANPGMVRQHKALAMGKQVPTSTIKKPGSKSTGGGLSIKTKY